MPILLKKELQDRGSLGLFDRPATSGLNKRFLREALNIDYRGGVLARRLGTRRINNTALSGTMHGVYYARFQNGTNERLVAHGANISRVTREPTAITTSLPTDWAARIGGKTYFLKVNDYVFMCNGVDNDIKYGGTNLQKWGISAPALAPTISEVAGLVISTRRYVATYVNNTSKQEGPPSGQTANITLDSENATASSPATPTDPQVDKWRLYAAVVEGGRPGVFYRVGEANLGVSITDNFSNASLKVRNVLEEFVNDPPAGPFYLIVLHKGRVLAVPNDDKSIIYVSDHDGFFAKPESFPVLNYLLINYRDGDIVTAIVSFDDYWLAFKKYSIWAVMGSWPDVSIKPVSYRPDYTSIGTIEQRAVIAFDNEVVFPSHDGVYVLLKGFRGGESLFKTRKISSVIDDFYNVVDQNQPMNAIYDRSRRQYRLFCTLRTGQDVDAVVVT